MGFFPSLIHGGQIGYRELFPFLVFVETFFVSKYMDTVEESIIRWREEGIVFCVRGNIP